MHVCSAQHDCACVYASMYYVCKNSAAILKLDTCKHTWVYALKIWHFKLHVLCLACINIVWLIIDFVTVAVAMEVEQLFSTIFVSNVLVDHYYC